VSRWEIRRGTVWYVSDLLQSIVKKTNIFDSPASFLLSVISAIHMENVTGYSALLTRRCQEARCCQEACCCQEARAKPAKPTYVNSREQAEAFLATGAKENAEREARKRKFIQNELEGYKIQRPLSLVD
jgi:hypothetical protein